MGKRAKAYRWLDFGLHRVPLESVRLEDDLGQFKQDPDPRIVIDADVHGPARASVELHELIHMVADIRGAGLSERRVLALEAGLGELMGRNPAFFHELVDRLAAGYESRDSSAEK